MCWARCLDHLVEQGGRLALLGAGDAAIEADLRHRGGTASRPHGGLHIGYDEALLASACRAAAMPSWCPVAVRAVRADPALRRWRYGCVPVVARTGGLADTVIDANEAALDAGRRHRHPVSGRGLSQSALLPRPRARDRVAYRRARRCWTTHPARRHEIADFSWEPQRPSAYAALVPSAHRRRLHDPRNHARPRPLPGRSRAHPGCARRSACSQQTQLCGKFHSGGVRQPRGVASPAIGAGDRRRRAFPSTAW